MDNITLESCLVALVGNTCVKSFYVIARDELKLVKFDDTTVLIVNTGTLKSGGQHWIAFFVFFDNTKLVAHYFDSFGKSPSFYKMKRLPFKVVSENDIELQSQYSSTCGLFCLHWVYWISRGKPTSLIVKSFGKNVNNNDNMVVNMYKALYNIARASRRAPESLKYCTKLATKF